MQVGIRVIAAVGAFALQASAAASDLSGFLETARGADIVILGEIHDNSEHHRNQAAIVAALQPAALVFEMFPQADEDMINALRDEGADRAALAGALDWSESGWGDFDFYAEILEAAPEARVFGAGQPVAEVRRATVEGAAGVFGPDAAAYGLDVPLAPEDQADREARMAAAHCDALPPERLPGLVEAQRFRDAGIADAALWARTMTGEGQVVVIAGSGHADRRRGVPAALAIADPEVSVVSLGQFEAESGAPGDFDDVILAEAPERADPCAGLDPTAE
jgi:uncharacterized iron-regulated protein